MKLSKFFSGSQEDDMSRRNSCESPEPLVCANSVRRGFVGKWGGWDREVFEFLFSKN